MMFIVSPRLSLSDKAWRSFNKNFCAINNATNMWKNFLKHSGRFSFITCFAGHTIRWLSSNLISFIHVIKKELASESDIWKRLAKSCTKSPNLKRILTNNNYNSSFSILPGPGFKICLDHHPWNTSLVSPSKFVVVLSNNALQMP
jgi:hypothetical protein